MKRLRNGIKALFRPIVNLLRKVIHKLMRDVIEEIQISYPNNQNMLIPYYKEELIRIMFLFQAASFWPSWETFYEACISDPRIWVEFAFLDELYGDTTQMLTARKFLDEKKIPYKIYSDSFFAKFNPHILVMQTPYDYGHRDTHVHSAAFKKRGTRIVYIPYGIELSDTEHARDAHFDNPVVRNSWRVFTFSERMREDYRRYCSNYHAVKCLGHPKFDGLYQKDKFPMLPEIQQRVKGRKILVWHVHFPKLIPLPDGREVMVTPELEIYMEFAKYIIQKADIFTVLLPHPKFLDGEGELGIRAKKIVKKIADAENGYVDWSDDYRNTMLNCDFFITDRSALMIEAATVNVPILYMSNSDYSEPLTAAIQPMVDSYYQGTTFDDMKRFVLQCLREEDSLKDSREYSFEQCIPYFDGHSGERIKDHVVEAIGNEDKDELVNQIYILKKDVEKLHKKIDTLTIH